MSPRDDSSQEGNSIVITAVGQMRDGENYFRGWTVGTELAGRVGFWSTLSLAVGHKLLTPSQERLLDVLSTSTLAADPRIWSLKVARLGACWGAPLVGMATAFLAFQDAAAGPAAAGRAAVTLCEARTLLGAAWEDEAAIATLTKRWLRERGRIDGLGVPYRDEDERLLPVRAYLRQHGHDTGPFLSLVEAMGRSSVAEGKAPVNFGGVLAALLLDMGFGPEQVDGMTLGMVFVPVVANAVEEAQQKNAAMAELPDAAIRYGGPAPRRTSRWRPRDAGGKASPP